MTLGQVTRPEDDVIQLQLRDSNGNVTKVIDTFKEYSFNSNFLTPTDGFHFTIGDEALNRSMLDGITLGQRVTLSINGHTQADGFIYNISVTSSRHGGTDFTIEGRDRLAPVVDANLDRQSLRFTAGQTLYDVLFGVFSQFSWTDSSQYLISNEANRNVITGAVRGVPTTKKGKPLKSFSIHQLKPYPHEGAFAFASRVAQRFGLWIWLSAEGNFLIISQPEYAQEPRYKIRHLIGDKGIQNNVISSHVKRNSTSQPGAIVATGFGGGGEYDKSSLKCVMIGPFGGYVNGSYRPEANALLALHKDAIVVQPAQEQLSALAILDSVTNFSTVPFVTVFLHDDESKTMDELQAFTRREMALHSKNAIEATYVVEGHENNGYPWCVDATVDVDDDVSGISGTMWIMSRTFEKSRDGGTRTTLELILPYSLLF